MTSLITLKEIIKQGEIDKIFEQIYGFNKSQADYSSRLIYHKNRLISAADAFKIVFNKDDKCELAIYSAPGRTEIGGNHTDHQCGKVLTAAVDLDAIACISTNKTNTINVFSEGYGMVSVDCSDLDYTESERFTSTAIIRGILRKISEMGYAAYGFDAYVTSDVKGGSGLSSSACFEVLIGTIINDLFCNNEISACDIAKIGQYAENEYFGKPSGLLDQMGCAIGGIISVDFHNNNAPLIHKVDFDFSSSGHALCIIDTGSDHSGLTDYYAEIPKEMKSVAHELGVDVLGQTSEMAFCHSLPQIRQQTGDRAVMRAIHFFSENTLVDRQVEALEKNDFGEFLRLVNKSGNSSFKYLQNVDTYQDPDHQPVALALALSEMLLKERGASRVHGGGFAGSIQAFVPVDMINEFKNGIEALLGAGACHVTTIRPVGGIRII